MRIIIEINDAGTEGARVLTEESLQRPAAASENDSVGVATLQLRATNAGPAPARGGPDMVVFGSNDPALNESSLVVGDAQPAGAAPQGI